MTTAPALSPELVTALKRLRLGRIALVAAETPRSIATMLVRSTAPVEERHEVGREAVRSNALAKGRRERNGLVARKGFAMVPSRSNTA